MAEVLAKTLDMSRDEWLEARREGIGGSDAAAICGLNKWRSPFEVWMEKTGQLKPKEAGEAAYWGTQLEDLVAREFMKRTGLKVQRRNAILRHPKYHFMLANLDRVIVGSNEGPGILECKTTSSYKAKEWEEDKVPMEYIIQVQHYLAVTGYQYAYIAVLIGGNKFLYKRIERDEELIKNLIAIESEFWTRVVTMEPPPPDGSAACTELLKEMYPEGEDSEIQLPSEAEKIIEQYDEAAEQEKIWAERKAEAENKLKEMLKKNSKGYIGERTVSWTNVTSARFDSKRFKQENPDLYSKYQKESSYRRFSVK